MNWFIEISGTSLTEEAKRTCKLNNIYQLDQLVNHYIKDKELSELNEITKNVQAEISSFIDKLLNFFADVCHTEHENDETSANDFQNIEVKKQKIENLSIEELLGLELINTRLYNICVANGIKDLSMIYNEFSTKDTFRHFRGAGANIDTLIIKLMDKYEINDLQINKNDLYRLDVPVSGKNSFEIFLKKLHFSEYSLSLKILQNLFKLEEEKLFLFLCDFYLKLKTKKGIGLMKLERSQKLIQRYFKERKDLNSKQNHFFRMVKTIDKFPFSINTFEFWSSYNESVHSLLIFLFESYERIKTRDLIYIKNFLCFYDGYEQVSYEELLKIIQREIDPEIGENTMKVHVNRARAKAEEVFDAIIKTTGSVYLLDNIDVERGDNFILLNDKKIEEINSELSISLTKEFYRFLLKILLEDQYKDLRSHKDIRVLKKDKILYFIKNKYFIAFENAIESLKEQYKIRRFEETKFKISYFTSADYNDALKEAFKAYVLNEYEDIAIENNLIILPQNSEYKKKIKDYLQELFEDLQRPLEYKELVKLFDERYPNVRSSYRSLRDALLTHEEFTHFGDRRGKYLLKEWENKFITGPIKELIIMHFKEIKNRDHMYNIYKSVKKKREEVTFRAVYLILSSFNFFISEKGGVYYYQDFPPSTKNRYTRSIYRLNNIIEKIPKEDLMIHRQLTIDKLSHKYPEYSKAQIEYAIDLRMGIVDV